MKLLFVVVWSTLCRSDQKCLAKLESVRGGPQGPSKASDSFWVKNYWACCLQLSQMPVTCLKKEPEGRNYRNCQHNVWCGRAVRVHCPLPFPLADVQGVVWSWQKGCPLSAGGCQTRGAPCCRCQSFTLPSLCSKGHWPCVQGRAHCY